MKLPLTSYSEDSPDLKVFSYVIEVPFAPLDLDIGRLARELGWNPELDRFRIWNILKIPRRIGRHCPYVIIRKVDAERDVMLHCRIDFNHQPHSARCDEACAWMAISTLCNDDEYPDRFLSLFVNLPPNFHSPEELRVVKREWSSNRSLIEGFRGSLRGARGEKPSRELTPSDELKILVRNVKESYFEGIVESDRMSECIKIVEGINKEANCGFCVGVQLEGLPDEPEDIVALCVGELNENGHPKEQQFLTLEEAEILGMALIRTRAYRILQQKNLKRRRK